LRSAACAIFDCMEHPFEQCATAEAVLTDV
jgi:hypothetical protein